MAESAILKNRVICQGDMLYLLRVFYEELIMLKSEMIEIFNQDLQNEINLFLGAGFSVYAKNKSKERKNE